MIIIITQRDADKRHTSRKYGPWTDDLLNNNYNPQVKMIDDFIDGIKLS
jgi:hypothetical protein